MKKWLGFCVALLCLVVMAGNAQAQYYRHPHSSVQFGVYVGVPYPYPVYPRYVMPAPVYWPPVYVAPSAPVVINQTPPVYVEKPTPAPVSVPQASNTLEAGYWYYCAQSQAYYPYVKECPSGWQKVEPAPAK